MTNLRKGAGEFFVFFVKACPGPPLKFTQISGVGTIRGRKKGPFRTRKGP